MNKRYKKGIVMTTIKSYTNIEQSKKLAEILPFETADMFHFIHGDNHSETIGIGYSKVAAEFYSKTKLEYIPCWSLAALLKYLREIKPLVYIPILFPNKSEWILQFAEYGHGNVCEVSCNNPIDACYEMILKLKELNLL